MEAFCFPCSITEISATGVISAVSGAFATRHFLALGLRAIGRPGEVRAIPEVPLASGVAEQIF